MPADSLQNNEQTIKTLCVNFERGEILVERGNGEERFALHEPEGFKVMSDAWLRANWEAKYVYSFTWFGRPIIQLPDDILRLQEIIYRIKPDVIIETGVAHGGSLVFYASLCKAIGKGRVIGIDIEIRPHNRKAIEEHPLFSTITLIEGDSTSQNVLLQAKSKIAPDDVVMVILDSCHTKEHVLKELEMYSPLVSSGSYIVAMDGIMQSLVGASRTKPDWNTNNPRSAIKEFIQTNPNFAIAPPCFEFNEGTAETWPTYAPEGFLKRTV